MFFIVKSLLKRYTLDSSTTPPCYRLVKGAPARWRREMAKTLTVLEVQHTVLMSSETARRCVWVCRAGPSPDFSESPEEQNKELQRRLANLQRDLKLYLSERNIIRASIRGRPNCSNSVSGSDSEEEYTSRVRSALGSRLDAVLDTLVAEGDAPAGSCGIPTRYVQGESSVPLVLLGGAGCGKATLLGRAASLAHTWLDDLALVVRFVGLTSQSSSSHQLLKSLVDHLHVLHTGSVYRGRNEPTRLSSTLGRLLEALGRTRPVLLCVAGTDALRGMGPRWFEPRPWVRKKRKPCSLRVPPPTARLVPLFHLKLPSKLYRKQTETDTAPELVICDELEAQLEQILITTEAALGADRVKACLSVLTASRRGLDDAEILDILAHDDLFRSEETYLPWAPAALLWPQLAALLSPWLRWDSRGAARWRDAALAAVAAERYLTDMTARSLLLGRMVQRKRCKDDWTSLISRKQILGRFEDPETFAKKPYFTQLDWVHDKLAATDCGHYLEDIGLVHIDPLPEHIQILKEVFETHSYALDYDHRQFYGLLRSTIERRQREGVDIQSEIVHSWMKDLFDPPVPTFYPMNEDFWKVDDVEKSDVEGFHSKPYDLIVRFDTRGKYIATVSTEKEEICVWDVTRCKLVRKLIGVTHPINLVPIDEYSVLVCGDETQKPFPLLVWSLTSRKLLYDLRIPHHDFITSKAAITYEGSYVCVVSRELEEPSPNFIVVYDLQSGTLFKKWKPGCDTVALAISSADGCVLSSLADTRILVWDLVTGNCRLTLRGHVSAATQLRLSRSGGVLLSADLSLTPADRALRLWDLRLGKPIAVYTPPQRVTSCEILLGGSILALALENYKDIVCVKLYGPDVEAVRRGQELEYDEDEYGYTEYEGRTFDVGGGDT
ncbi:unnamed protein product [Leptidea sinapis]|uniref:NWD1/2-like winged helix-turn-helix domain-containing protein n=1 Tax=Leptidea sinapis TaxID=189913 RepID=A0A5E4Q2K2_9NEOP|nr:unnamed protein product [Leptidea sinapis]